MLSMPPARFAALTSRSAACCGWSLVSRIAWIWSSVTIPVRPSLHSSRRSPSSSAIESSSTSTSRVGAERAGQDVPVRMHLRLGLGDLARLHHPGDQGVVAS